MHIFILRQEICTIKSMFYISVISSVQTLRLILLPNYLCFCLDQFLSGWLSFSCFEHLSKLWSVLCAIMSCYMWGVVAEIKARTSFVLSFCLWHLVIITALFAIPLSVIQCIHLFVVASIICTFTTTHIKAFTFDEVRSSFAKTNIFGWEFSDFGGLRLSS